MQVNNSEITVEATNTNDQNPPSVEIEMNDVGRLSRFNVRAMTLQEVNDNYKFFNHSQLLDALEVINTRITELTKQDKRSFFKKVAGGVVALGLMTCGVFVVGVGSGSAFSKKDYTEAEFYAPYGVGVGLIGAGLVTGTGCLIHTVKQFFSNEVEFVEDLQRKVKEEIDLRTADLVIAKQETREISTDKTNEPVIGASNVVLTGLTTIREEEEAM